MPVTWDETPSSGGITWDDEPKPSMGQSLWKGAKGTAAGVADLATGLVKFPAGIALGAVGSMLGERPDIARDAAHQAIEDVVPGFSRDMGDNQAYQAIMKPFELLSEGIDWAGNKLSDDPGRRGAIKQALDIGTFALPGMGHYMYRKAKGAIASDPLMDRSLTHEEPTAGQTPDMVADTVKVDPGGRFMLNTDELPKGLDGRMEPVGGKGTVVWDEPGKKDPTGIDADIRTKEEIALDAEKEKIRQQEFNLAQGDQATYPLEDRRNRSPEDGPPARTTGGGMNELDLGQQVPYAGNTHGGILDQNRLTVDENGIPIDQARSAEIAQADYEQAPQGDLFKSREPTLESSLVPKDVQDVIRPTEEQVIPRTDLTLEPVDQIPLRNRNPETQPYEQVDPLEINRERQDIVSGAPDELVYPGRELTDFGTVGEQQQARRDAEANTAAQDLLAREEGDPMQRTFPSMIGRGPGGKQSGSFDPAEIGKGLAKIYRRAANKIKEPLKPIPIPQRQEPKLEKGTKEYLSSDTRSAEEFIKQEANKQDNWKDISRYWTNFLPGSNIAEIAKHPAIKWIVSQAQNHTRKALLNKEESKYGAKFAPRGGINKNRWNARMRSDDGALTVFENMKWADAKDALKLWIDKYDGNNITMDAQSLAADGMKPQQIKAILAARKQLDAFAKQYNAEAAKHGYPRITPRSNYFPHVYRGDYRVFVRDSKGEAKWVEGAETKRQASAMRDELAKRFPGLDVQFREASNKYDINDTQSFRDALGILPKNSAEYKALQQAYTDILKRRGFQKATLFRKGAPGFMGMKDGKAGIKEGLEGLAMYFDRGHNFLANQRIRSDLGEILSGLKKAGTDLKQLTPNAHEYMGAYVDNATNATKDGLQMVTDVIEAIGQSTGQGKSFVSNNLGKVNALASALWLTTPKFALAQFLQPLFNIPAGLKLKHLTGSSASVLNAWGRSYKEYISPSAYTIEAMNWAKENGYIDSKILDLMGLKHETYASKLGKAAQLYTRWGLGKIEQEVVRSPSFIFYDHLLKDVIKDKVQRWKTAGELTDKVMVNYATVDAPLMYSKSGIVGEAARPLKQFSHSYFGQMLEYMQHAKDKSDVKPLAAMLAIQANVSGLKGMMGLAEATLVINAINSTFNTQIPTPNQLLATMGAPEWLRFGTVSSVTGLDLSGTTGAPQIGQMATLPGAQFAGKGIHDIGGYAADLATGMDTEAGKMKAMQSIAPTLAQGSIEDYFTKPGMGPPNPNNKMQPDTGPRDFEDRFYRNVIGGRSVKETEERENLKALKQKDLKDKALKTKILDTIVDRFVEGKENSDELVQKWLELGGNPDSLPNEIIGQMKKRSMTYIERYINGQQGLSLAQKATKLREFGLMIENATPEELSQFMEDIK